MPFRSGVTVRLTSGVAAYAVTTRAPSSDKSSRWGWWAGNMGRDCIWGGERSRVLMRVLRYLGP